MYKETISEYYLERYVLGELTEEEKEEISRLASHNREIQDAIDRLKASNREILEFYPPHTIKANLQAQLSRASKPFSIKPFLVVSSAAAAFLIFILILPLFRHESNKLYSNSEEEVTLVKGIAGVDLNQTQLLVYRKLQDQVELLKDGEKAQAGDLLQLAYVSAEGTYGMIFSIDGRGFITLHFPEHNGESTKLESHKQFLLANAIELDDAPGFERFFFLTSDFPFNVNSILKEAQNMTEDLEKVQTQNLHLPENFYQYTILILKGEGL